MKKITFVLAFIFATLFLKAQILNPTTWTFDSKQNGNEVELIFKAVIGEGWHLYDTDLPEGGPIATAFVYEDSTLFENVGKIQKNPESEKHFDETFQMNVGYFSNQVILTQNIKLATANQVDIKGYVLFMSCNDETCTPPEEVEFSFRFNDGVTMNSEADEVSTTSSGSGSGQTLWLFILIS